MPRLSATHSLESALRELQTQRDSIDEAIVALRGLIAKTNGRPVAASAPRGRKPGRKSTRSAAWTETKRRAAATRMRAYWKRMRTQGKRGTKRASRPAPRPVEASSAGASISG